MEVIQEQEVKGKVTEVIKEDEGYLWKIFDTIEEFNDSGKLISKTEIYKQNEWQFIKTYQNVTHHNIMRIDKDGLHLYRHNTYDENNNLIYSC